MEAPTFCCFFQVGAVYSLSCGEGVPVEVMDRRGVGWGEHSRRGKGLAGCRPERGERRGCSQ